MDINSLTHTKWECKYPIVFAPKDRRQVLLLTPCPVTRFAMHRNCILYSFALAALGISAHSARKHLAEQWYVNSNRQVIYKDTKADVGQILGTLCRRKGIEIIEAECCGDHIHMLVKIPPKYSRQRRCIKVGIL